MGQTEHRAYVDMKNAQDKAKRNPAFSDYKEEADWSLEAAINFALSGFSNPEYRKGFVKQETILKVLKAGVETGYKFGTKWQAERIYSEEDMFDCWKACSTANISENSLRVHFNHWFENFKKK